MEQLKCKNCGAPLTSSGKCEYCGAVYRIERKQNQVIRYELEHPGVTTLESTTIIDRFAYEHFPEEAVADKIIRDMRIQFADQLAAFIRIDRDYDLKNDAVLIRGRLRVVEPNYRFIF